MDPTIAYKLFTHDLRSPVRGGAPVWDGRLPYTLPTVAVDESSEECAVGWNACRDPTAALRIAGLWPDGRPSRLYRVETDALVIERGEKLRAATWTIVEEIAEAQLTEHVRALSEPFGDFADEITAEQMAWRAALARPRRDAEAVEAGLTDALTVRGLSSWTLRRHDSARAARAAWALRDTMYGWDARDARAAWDTRAARAVWDAWAVRDAMYGWDARTVRDAMYAWDARDARNTWNTRAARAAWDALTFWYTARRDSQPPDLLTIGLRDAYAAGLAVVVPLAHNVLGWVMEK